MPTNIPCLSSLIPSAQPLGSRRKGPSPTHYWTPRTRGQKRSTIVQTLVHADQRYAGEPRECLDITVALLQGEQEAEWSRAVTAARGTSRDKNFPLCTLYSPAQTVVAVCCYACLAACLCLLSVH